MHYGSLIPGYCFPQVKIGAFCAMDLRAVCEKGLLLLTITIPEMEVYKSSYLTKTYNFPLNFWFNTS